MKMENENLYALVNRLALLEFLNICSKTKCLTNKNHERRFIMKLIFKKKDGNVHLPRKAKDEAKKNIKQVLSGGVLKNLQKTIIGNHSAYDRDYAIYSEENVDYQKIFSIENHQTNYLAGQITSDIFFLVDIGELVWVVDHFEMMDFEENKRIITHLKSIL